MFKTTVFLAAFVILASAEYRWKRATNTYNPHAGLTVTVESKSLATCTNIPTKVVARITKESLGLGRTNFNKKEHDNRMKEMGAVNCDDKGHIIASSLGGVAETWNLFPQAMRLNRGKESESIETDIRRSNWKGMERKAKTFLNGATSKEPREVVWTIYFDYPDQRNPCRPYDIQLNYNFYKNGRETEREGHNYVNDNFGYNGCT